MAELSAGDAAKLSAWRAAGESIVFTNGVFDLLHPGHLQQLRQAKSFGDRLVVGLNTDASVRRLGKGKERPLLPQDARYLLLSELSCVDMVLLFDEDTPEELIRLVHPDVLAKGADYAGRFIAGADFVRSYGGRVELVDLVPGWSTTALLQRIRGK
jgi:D-beta-D-heptose 7-phosphate kinase / D-beta-D-heptose 1-phosphate adenosyltransferase